MKKIKRVLSITLCALIIFTILCTSVFAYSPLLPEIDTNSQTLYTPVSNLKTILVRSRDKIGLNDVYASLSSPYGFLEKNPTNLYLNDSSLSFTYSIGNYKQSSLEVPYNVMTTLDPYSGSSGAYIKETVNLIPEGSSPLDITLVYGESVVPLEQVSSRVNDFTNYPFYSTYNFQLFTFDNYTFDATIEFHIEANVLSFDYSYDPDTHSYIFEYGPEFETIYYDYVYEQVYDNDLSYEYGHTIYPEISWTPFLDIMDRAQDLVIDSTSGSKSYPYTLIQDMTVSVKAYATSDPSVEILVDHFHLIDYVYEHYNTSEIWFPPLYDHALKIFNEMFPTYTQDEGFIDLDFNDFLISVLDMFNVPLFGYFSLADLLFGIAGIGLLIWFIKMFAGG